MIAAQTPPRKDIKFVQGDDWADLVVRWTAGGDPVLIASARLQVRERLSRPIALALSEGDGLDLSTPGEVAVSITAAQSRLLTKTNYVWDLEATADSGQTKTLAGGAMKVVPDVTHD